MKYNYLQLLINLPSKKLKVIFLLKPFQNKKGPKNLGYPKKKQSFYLEKDCFFSGTPNIFGPSYFEVALNHVIIRPTRTPKSADINANF